MLACLYLSIYGYPYALSMCCRTGTVTGGHRRRQRGLTACATTRSNPKPVTGPNLRPDPALTPGPTQTLTLTRCHYVVESIYTGPRYHWYDMMSQLQCASLLTLTLTSNPTLTLTLN